MGNIPMSGPIDSLKPFGKALNPIQYTRLLYLDFDESWTRANKSANDLSRDFSLDENQI